MGHGHVTPNPGGAVARCGGPLICKECAIEQANLRVNQHIDALNSFAKEKFGDGVIRQVPIDWQEKYLEVVDKYADLADRYAKLAERYCKLKHDGTA